MFERKICRFDMIKCSLCYDAPCSKVCRELDPARLLRSIWFDNEESAAVSLPNALPCADCDAPCERACVRSGEVPVRRIVERLNTEVKPFAEDIGEEDESVLRTSFFGKPMENPFLLSSSVVGSTYEKCSRAFDAGWAGVVFKTICSIDIHEASPRFSSLPDNTGSIFGFKNIEQLSVHSVEEDMDIIRRLKENYPDKIIIASIMGRDDEEWEKLAKECEKNGADAIELNFSCPNMVDGNLGSAIGEEPELVKRFTAAAKCGTGLPVLAKLTPNVASMNPAAAAAAEGGADGISAINTIKSIIGISRYTYVSAPAVHGMSASGGYSGNAVRPVALRFIEELCHNTNLEGLHISAMGGIETWSDALEFILLGASSVQVTTAVMQYGYRIIDDLKSGMIRYIREAALSDVGRLRGLALDSVSDTTDVLERDTILFPKIDPDKCIGCGRCVISCMDGGHEALTMDENRRIRLNGSKCAGCHLCLLVCPSKAIRPAHKRIVPRTK